MEELEIRGWKLGWNQNPTLTALEDQRKAATMIEPNARIFEEAFRGSKYFNSGYIDIYQKYSNCGYEEHILGLLLTLLPKLTSLTLSVPRDYHNCFIATITSIAHDLKSITLEALTSVTLTSECSRPSLHVGMCSGTLMAYACSRNVMHLNCCRVYIC